MEKIKETLTSDESSYITTSAIKILRDMRVPPYSWRGIVFCTMNYDNQSIWIAYNNNSKVSYNDTILIIDKVRKSIIHCIFDTNTHYFTKLIKNKINKLLLEREDIGISTNAYSIISLLLAIGLNNALTEDIMEINSIVFTTNEIIRWVSQYV